jgi:hypothetical protein
MSGQSIGGERLVIPPDGSIVQLGVQFGGSILGVPSGGTGMGSDTEGTFSFYAEGTEIGRWSASMGAVQLQKFSVSYGDLNTAGSGSAALFGTEIPVGAIIVRAFAKVSTSFAGDGDSGSTLSIGIQDQSVDVKGATALSGWAAGFVEGIQAGAAANMLSVATSAKQLAVIWTAGGTDTVLTDGAMTVYVQYIY